MFDWVLESAEFKDIPTVVHHGQRPSSGAKGMLELCLGMLTGD